jgi:cytidine deaminase
LILTRRDALLSAVGGAFTIEAWQTRKDFRGQISPAEVNALLESEKLTRDALMRKLLPDAQSHAHAPISNYFVGAVASGVSGALYFGQNIEIDRNPLGLAIHAEQSAIANAFMSDEAGIGAIAIKGPPCGHCRQFLSEIDLSMRILTPDQEEFKLADLLPHAFGPKNLGVEQRVFQAVARPFLSASVASPLNQQAWKAASQAYCPYSKSPSGAAILTSNNRIFAGSYIENAAFNPSLPPLQAALAGYFAAGPTAGTITRAVLAEDPKAIISHYATTQATLAAFAPNVKLEHLH